MESFFSGRSSRFGKSSVKNRKISARRVEIPSNDSYPSLVLTLERDDFSSLRLRVRPGGDVILHMPRTLPESLGLDFVLCKRAWIVRKQRELAESGGPRACRDGVEILERGERLTLRILDEGLPRHRIERRQGELLIRGGSMEERSLIRALQRYRRKKAEAFLPRRTEELHLFVCRILKDTLPMPELLLRELGSRWGTCARRREGSRERYRITLATSLMNLPPDLADYVILHELCHMRRMDHSQLFHALLERVCPGHADKRRALRRFRDCALP